MSFASRVVFSGAAICALVLSSSCVLEPVEGPGFASEVDFFVLLDTLGTPSACCFTQGGGLAAIAAGGAVIVADVEDQAPDILFEVADTLLDVEFTSDGLWCAAISADSLYYVPVVDPGSVEALRLPSTAVSIAAPAGASALWVFHDDGTISTVGLPGWTITLTVDTPLDRIVSACAASDGLHAYAGDSTGVYRVYPANGAVSASIETTGACLDIFPAGYQKVGIACGGSNEIWVLAEETLDASLLVTFPSDPVQGASIPDGGYIYASCPGYGLVVCSQSSSQELVTSSYGLPSDIAVSPNGDYTAVLDPEARIAYFLKR
jgi:hypothetical protein